MDILELLGAFNGSALMEAGHQEWGYIEEKWYLALPIEIKPNAKTPEEIKVWNKPHIMSSPFDDARAGILKKEIFLKANFQLLKSAGLSDEHALLGSFMRMSLVELGALAFNPKERNVLIDEYAYVTPPDGGWDAVVLPKLQSGRDIAAWAKRFTTTIMAHIMFVFCARGHHWTPEFVDLYKRLFDNSFVGSPQGWSLPTSEILYRSFLHCLGVSPLIQICLNLIRDNKLPAAMIIRFKPAPPIAGVAHITTLNAIMQDMKRHALWERIHSWKKKSIDRISEAVNIIHDDPYAYHVASKVLCGKERKVATEQWLDAFRDLAPIALGYVQFLGKKHSLWGEQAVTQKYGGKDPLVEMWNDAFDRFGLPSVRKLDVDSFFAEIMDNPEARQARANKAKAKAQMENLDLDLEVAQKEAQIAQLRQQARNIL